MRPDPAKAREGMVPGFFFRGVLHAEGNRPLVTDHPVRGPGDQPGMRLLSHGHRRHCHGEVLPVPPCRERPPGHGCQPYQEGAE